MKINDVIQACVSFREENEEQFKLRPLFDELYDGPLDEPNIANFIGTLHNSLKRTIDDKLDRVLMDSAKYDFTPEERLLVGIRLETAIGALPTLTGAICHRKSPDIELMALTSEEAVLWATTCFWSLVFSPSIVRAARMLSHGLDTLLANLPPS